ncbi:VanZ family protein [Butyrivibrio sp. VCB2006]|uniref:VanZ family protein n=1 Tax=Butyrivibrio sp. VCB2006 TaxID=1280679 RepID=UPI0018CADC13|nr:VanZ family protein [Butyrivibrio sp. VCB2006]
MLVEQTSGIRIIDIYMIFIMGALLILVPGYVVHIKKDIPYRRVIHLYFVIVCALNILLITVFRRDAGSKSGNVVSYFDFGSLQGSKRAVRQMIYSVLNVLLFVPWGVLVQLFWKEEKFFKRIVMSALMGFIFSASIEIIQHITKTGVFEITDLATNVSGTVLGAILGTVLTMIIMRFTKKNELK